MSSGLVSVAVDRSLPAASVAVKRNGAAPAEVSGGAGGAQRRKPRTRRVRSSPHSHHPNRSLSRAPNRLLMVIGSGRPRRYTCWLACDHGSSRSTYSRFTMMERWMRTNCRSGRRCSQQFWDTDRIGVTSDVYSLACLGFELLTGRTPYAAREVRIVAARHLAAPVPSLGAVQGLMVEEVDAVFAKALAKDPAERYVSAIEFVRALRYALLLSLNVDPDGEPTLDRVAPSESKRCNERLVMFARDWLYVKESLLNSRLAHCPRSAQTRALASSAVDRLRPWRGGAKTVPTPTSASSTRSVSAAASTASRHAAV